MDTIEFDAQRLQVAASLRALEQALAAFLLELAHAEPWVMVDTGAAGPPLQAICDAYGAIDLAADAAPNESVVCLGVIGVNRACFKLAERVNHAKAALREVCAPLQGQRRRVASKGGGTESVPLVRAMLRSIQRSDLNLLAAYRRIPLLEAVPTAISYTRARTRAVYRKSVAEIGDLLRDAESPAAVRDRERIATLPKREKQLALVRGYYENVRANVAFGPGGDPQGRLRLMLPAELPLLFQKRASKPLPAVRFPKSGGPAAAPRRRETRLEAKPFLESLPVYRYRPITE